MKNRKAFTLVELIVVITILAVLGTIAFVSFQGYAVSSRDSARLSNLKVTQKALQYYLIENATYPEPSNGTAITFSGAEVWTQGTIGESVVQQIKRLTSVPTDPLTGSEIAYSRLNTKGEIELATTFEKGLAFNQQSNVHAGDTQGIAYIVGDYNGLVAKVSTGSSVYVLAVPSIINGDISVDDYSSLMGSNKLSVQGKNVIPASYTGTTFDSDNTYDLGITNLVVYSGSTLPTTQTELNNFVTTLQDTYSGSTIQDVSEIGVLVQTTDANDLLVLGSGLLQNSLAGESVELTEITYSCATNPGYSNATFVEGDPTVADQVWQNTNNTNPCYYTCTSGYTGNDCSTAPVLITKAECTGASWLWTESDQDVYIGSTRGSGFCISPAVGNFGTGVGNGISWNGWGNYDNSTNALDYNGWDASAIDDSGNGQPGGGQTRVLDSKFGYNCKALGTALDDFVTTDDIVGRMKWIAASTTNRVELTNIDWVTGARPLTGDHPTPALYLADCIDGVKDLTTDMNYTHSDNITYPITYSEYTTDVVSDTDAISTSNITYQNRQKYLIGWTQQSGSHLPSAFSNITTGHPGGCLGSNCDGNLNILDKGEYQMAYLANGITDIDWVWIAGIGDTDGSHWGRQAALLGKSGPNDISYAGTGLHNGNMSARFVIRP